MGDYTGKVATLAVARTSECDSGRHLLCRLLISMSPNVFPRHVSRGAPKSTSLVCMTVSPSCCATLSRRRYGVHWWEVVERKLLRGRCAGCVVVLRRLGAEEKCCDQVCGVC